MYKLCAGGGVGWGRPLQRRGYRSDELESLTVCIILLKASESF